MREVILERSDLEKMARGITVPAGDVKLRLSVEMEQALNRWLHDLRSQEIERASYG